MNFGDLRGTVQLSLRQVDKLVKLLPAPDTWLSAQESQRLQSMPTKSRRAQFLAGHWLARHSASNWLGGRWADYQLSAPMDTAPVWIAGPDGIDWQDVYISLSHSGNWVACAMAFEPIGVDVELSRRSRDFTALAQWILSEKEAQRFLQLPPEAQKQYFYTQWTLKEAWVKQAQSSTLPPSMKAIQFVPGASSYPAALLAQTSNLTLAVYPASRSNIQTAGARLSTMQWFEWACSPPH